MRKNKKKQKKSWFKSLLMLGLGLFFVLTGFFIIWVSNLKIPDFKQFDERKVESSTKIYDRTGEILLYDVHRDIKRTIIPFEEMGENITKATVAIEDSEFYNHKGIRISSIIRATIWAKLTGRKIQGGSTITQQVIKNTLLTSEVSLARKIKEWMLAIKLEQNMDKNDILALYLNEAPYGGNIYGIKEATKYFFAKDPVDLTLAESAYMAAIPNGPTYYSPYGKNKDKLDGRKNLVLSRMLEVGLINENEYQEAKEEKVVFLPQQKGGILAPHFVFYVKDYLENKYGQNTLEEGGLKVITTIDYELQEKIEKIILEKSKENELNWGGKNAASVVIDPKTGQILAMVGSRDYFDREIDGNFNVATAKRQPGSSFKPIVYALAFEKGYTDETHLFDVRTEFNSSCDPSGTSNKESCYNPDNWNNAFVGPVSLRNALAQSINIVAVKLLYLVGISDSIKMAQNLGITTLKNDPNLYGLSLVIGGGETTLLDMTSAYSVFANKGIKNSPKSILAVYDRNDNLLEEFSLNEERVIDENVTNIISSILSDNEARTPAFGSYSLLRVPGVDAAAKTGTTNDNKDAWTIGYTPNIAVGVWVGNNDNIPMKKGGVAMAGPIWNAVMVEALRNKEVEKFEEPKPLDPSLPPVIRGIWQNGQTHIIDTISGKLATEYTPEETKKEVFDFNVHSILHWIDKNNPLNKEIPEEITDSQYNSWEYGVNNWWQQNKIKYDYEIEIPTEYDDVHTSLSKPVFEVIGLENKKYNKEDNILVEIKMESRNIIKKIDVFVNNTYLTSLKNKPYVFNFKPVDISDINQKNNIRIIVLDVLGNKSEEILGFDIE